MRMTITREFKTLEQAERFQDKLYDKYDCVRFVSGPRFEESGIYVWEVKP